MDTSEIFAMIKKSVRLRKSLATTLFNELSVSNSKVTQSDCLYFIDRTFDGYMTEITTVYGQLEAELGIKIQPAPDVWDRIYNVDFFIEIEGKYIGLQIKPVNQGIQLSQIFKEKALQLKSHEKFTKEYGGKVFYIFSSTINKKKEIRNPEVMGEIRSEISRLADAR